MAHKLAPAIAAGCPVVLKPASQTPFSAIALAELLIDECGLPAEQLSVVTGGGGTVGNAIVDHPDVAFITFTGSPEVGWGDPGPCRPQAASGSSSATTRRSSSSPTATGGPRPTRSRWPATATPARAASPRSGCYVHRSIADDFTAALAERVESLVVGDPLDEKTDVSALISTGDRDRVSSWVDEAVAAGAKLVAGGGVRADGVLEPTLLADATPDMKVCAKEVFGPVVAIQAYDDLDEAFAIANDTDYGLQAAIFTSDIAKAIRAARTLDFGGVLINEVPTWRADQMPYGGVRDSGNTREGPAYAVREMTELRVVVINP